MVLLIYRDIRGVIRGIIRVITDGLSDEFAVFSEGFIARDEYGKGRAVEVLRQNLVLGYLITPFNIYNIITCKFAYC